MALNEMELIWTVLEIEWVLLDVAEITTSCPLLAGLHYVL